MKSLLSTNTRLPLLLLGLCLAIAGCAEPPVDLGYVSGVITVDGKPLDNVNISFRPMAGGRPSFGLTNASGQYTLYHTSKFQGAELGEHKVEIDLMPNSSYYAKKTLTPRMGPQLGDGSSVALGQDMTMKTVSLGSQTYDFELSMSQLPKP
ncbi:hypothetical protein AB1K70_25835 [Bremerella sp. JC770]|uniref:hypothetical protein n=1 Tax=Bremerella sp. JC770 TaxID=3232137 RepID=UPI00345A8B21